MLIIEHPPLSMRDVHMPKFKIYGAESSTAKDVSVEVTADTPIDAESIASGRGIFVARVVEVMPPDRVPNDTKTNGISVVVNTPSTASGPSADVTLIKTHPQMFRNNPVAFILFVILIPVGFGALVLLIWWLTTINTTLTVTTRRTILRRGILSKHTREVRHSDVRFLEVDQGLFQRIFGVGNISVSSAGQGTIEITAKGILNPNKIKQTIDGLRP